MCTMTRQHFQFIADVVREDLKGDMHVAAAFARALQMTNKSFKKQTFINACSKEGKQQSLVKRGIKKAQPIQAFEDD